MDWRDDRIASARDGLNPTLIAEMDSGYAVMADMQFLPGWCILLPKRNVDSLNALDAQERKSFLYDMSVLGDAILSVCKPVRVNYDILGNSDQYLHAHVYPRYAWEQEEQLKLPVWLYENHCWSDPKTGFSEERHGALMHSIRSYLMSHR